LLVEGSRCERFLVVVCATRNGAIWADCGPLSGGGWVRADQEQHARCDEAGLDESNEHPVIHPPRICFPVQVSAQDGGIAKPSNRTLPLSRFVAP